MSVVFLLEEWIEDERMGKGVRGRGCVGKGVRGI